MESILKLVSEEPVDFTYLGIGSCPHVTAGQKLEAKYDQLVPQAFHEIIFRDKRQTRILHFDPLFDQYAEFLAAYFEEMKLIPLEFEGGKCWIGETLQVYILSQRLEHEEHFWFFESLCETLLNTKGKLVIQEYTGYELAALNRKLYDSCDQKEKYKRRILLDMTFGTDTGCCTDMTKAQPFYDYNGDFLNFHFATDKDADRWIGFSVKMDDMLRKKYRAKYLQSLNHIHVDYRRRLKGDTVMYGSPDYNNDSSPDDIMKLLQTEIRVPFEFLIKLRAIESSKSEVLNELFQNYKSYDPYKWYDLVSKLLPLP